MKNQRDKDTRTVRKGFVSTAVSLWILLFTTLSLLLYMALPVGKISPGTEKLLLLAISILLIAAICVWKFRYKPASKYLEEYKMENKMLKMLFKPQTSLIVIVLIILIAFGISFWYFGHYRSSQGMLNAEPIKKYKIVTPLPQNTPTPNTRSTPATTHDHQAEAASLTPHIPNEKHTHDHPSNPEHHHLPENVAQSEDTPVSQDGTEHEHTHSKEEQEALEKLIAESEKIIENAKHAQKEALEIMREAMPMVANYLNALSIEEQIEMLNHLKTTMSNQVAQQPPELQALMEEHNVFEEGWKTYLDMLAETGYTPPRNFQ